MGAKSWMLAFVDGRADEILKSRPQLDRAAAAQLASRLFPSERLEPIFLFHPLELGEAALLDLFGYQLEGMLSPSWVQPDEIPLAGFRR